MEKNRKTEIVMILDKSGSMETMVKEAVRGYNTFLEEQQEVTQ